MGVLKRVRKKYNVTEKSSNKVFDELVISSGKDLVNITVWKRDKTFGIYGDDNSPQGNESISLDKLEDLLEIIL